MTDRECVEFLQWALPRLRMRWQGFKKPRRQVCKRAARRMKELGLGSLAGYRQRLEQEPDEWTVLDAATRVTISRFFRDKGVYDYLSEKTLPAIVKEAAARGENSLAALSIGCAAGEEPYSLRAAWNLRVPAGDSRAKLSIIALDAGEKMIERAREACYRHSAVREVPKEMRDIMFEIDAGRFRLRDEFKRGVTFQTIDIRGDIPGGPYHIILCRNLVFTYYEEGLQRDIADRIVERLAPGGVLIIGRHERLPDALEGLEPAAKKMGVFRKK